MSAEEPEAQFSFVNMLARMVQGQAGMLVIDTKNDQHVEAVRAALVRHRALPGVKGVKDALCSLLPVPPKPEEPTGLGAVVEDATGRRWVRGSDCPSEGTSESPFAVWKKSDALTSTGPASYNEIAVVKVLSEGVTS
jgi:hypothetical protein